MRREHLLVGLVFALMHCGDSGGGGGADAGGGGGGGGGLGAGHEVGHGVALGLGGRHGVEGGAQGRERLRDVGARRRATDRLRRGGRGRGEQQGGTEHSTERGNPSQHHREAMRRRAPGRQS